MTTTAANTLNELHSRILNEYEGLSKRLQQIARFALDHPNDMALETIAVIANRADVQPSAVVRFAKAFGYSGFSDMQRVYQARLAEHAPSYSERIRLFRESHGNVSQPTTLDVLNEFSAVNIISLEHLQAGMDAEKLEQAVELLAGARDIHVVAQRRSFPVAAYLAYALSHIDRYAHLMDGVGGMLMEQMRALSRDDALIAVSFHPYAPETAEVVAKAAENDVPSIVITDSPLSPIASHATICFEVHDAELHTFRSLTASMCLAQAIAMGLGLRLDRGIYQRGMEA